MNDHSQRPSQLLLDMGPAWVPLRCRLDGDPSASVSDRVRTMVIGFHIYIYIYIYIK